MASSIMDSMLALVTPEMQRALAARVGESPQAVHSGLTSAGAAILDGLATKVDDDRFLPQALDFVSAAAAQDIGSNLSAIASAGPSGATADLADRVLPLVFGSQRHQVAQALAQQSGLRAASAMAVLRMAVPLLLAVFVAREAGSTSAAGTFANTLRAEAPALRTYLPRDLLGSAAGVERSNVPEPAAPPRWLVPTAAVGALLLAWLVIRFLTAPQEGLTVLQMKP